jgi:hypothetical protein
MCLVSLPNVSARPGVSMKRTSVYDALHVSTLHVVSEVSDCSLELTWNSFFFPHRVFRVELLPVPVDPITTIFLKSVAFV